jgi:hypothetical protein
VLVAVSKSTILVDNAMFVVNIGDIWNAFHERREIIEVELLLNYKIKTAYHFLVQTSRKLLIGTRFGLQVVGNFFWILRSEA